MGKSVLDSLESSLRFDLLRVNAFVRSCLFFSNFFLYFDEVYIFKVINPGDSYTHHHSLPLHHLSPWTDPCPSSQQQSYQPILSLLDKGRLTFCLWLRFKLPTFPTFPSFLIFDSLGGTADGELWVPTSYGITMNASSFLYFLDVLVSLNLLGLGVSDSGISVTLVTVISGTIPWNGLGSEIIGNLISKNSNKLLPITTYLESVSDWSYMNLLLYFHST